MKKVRVLVRLRENILDVQGKAIERSLPTVATELSSVDVLEGLRVRVGKLIELESEDGSVTEEDVNLLCQKLFANPVMESYEVVEVEGL